MNRLAERITAQLGAAVKEKATILRDEFVLSDSNEVSVIFYHEIM